MAWAFQDTVNFTVDMASRQVHGIHRLPRGYSFAHVPRDAIVAPLIPEVEPVLAVQSSAPQAVAALVQGAYSAFTLYNSQRGQVQKYGYAAFGLTVLPYTVMTLVNLLGTLLTPDYTTLYVVESDILAEARVRPGAVFHGIVGKLVPDTVPDHHLTKFNADVDEMGIRNTRITWPNFPSPIVVETGGLDVMVGFDPRDDIELAHVDGRDPTTTSSEAVPQPVELDILTQLPIKYQPHRHFSLQVPACSPFKRLVHRRFLPPPLNLISIMGVVLATLLVDGIIVLLLGYLSKWFDPADSTGTQQVWIILWLVSGSFGGLVYAILIPDAMPDLFLLISTDEFDRSPMGFVRKVYVGFFTVPYSSVAIGGFVVVAQMILEYGNCVEI
jgi:hypothetical protein